MAVCHGERDVLALQRSLCGGKPGSSALRPGGDELAKRQSAAERAKSLQDTAPVQAAHSDDPAPRTKEISCTFQNLMKLIPGRGP